jgi:hypothetical protein
MSTNGFVATTKNNKKTVPSQRNSAIDILKILASFGVVIIHTHNSSQSADSVFAQILCAFFLYYLSYLFYNIIK